MNYDNAARTAVTYVREGETGTLPTALQTLDPASLDQVLTAARRWVVSDGDRVVEAMVDQFAADLRR